MREIKRYVRYYLEKRTTDKDPGPKTARPVVLIAAVAGLSAAKPARGNSAAAGSAAMPINNRRRIAEAGPVSSILSVIRDP